MFLTVLTEPLALWFPFYAHTSIVKPLKWAVFTITCYHQSMLFLPAYAVHVIVHWVVAGMTFVISGIACRSAKLV